MRMDIFFQFRGWLELLLILVAFWVSWKLGDNVLRKKRSFLLAALVSILSSALILTPGGYYGAIYEPDAIGRGLVPFLFGIVFLIINSVNMIIFAYIKWLKK